MFGIVKKCYDFLSYWYLQYILLTSLYMLEPIERRIFNSILVAVVAMSVYTMYLFLPGHAIMIVNFVEYMFGVNNTSPTIGDI